MERRIAADRFVRSHVSVNSSLDPNSVQGYRRLTLHQILIVERALP